MIKLLPEEFKSLAQYVYSLCAITLDESKGYLIESRLASLVEETGSKSYNSLMQRARSEPSRALDRRIVDAITTNETLFFRDSSPFDLLRHKIVPELIDRKSRSQAPIRIWSAASSTGQELYSIAILLKELLGDTDRYGVRLVGTDISDDAVARASRRGLQSYRNYAWLNGFPTTRYFTQVAAGWQIRDEIRAMVSFKKLNLMTDFAGMGRFDVIFCRNVAIYFSESDRISLFGRLGRALETGGYLVIGAMESLNGISPQFESKRHLRSTFYQIKSGIAAA